MIFPFEIIIEISKYADASTKSRLVCLNRVFHVALRAASYCARKASYTSFNDILMTCNGSCYKTKYNLLPNRNIDGKYIEYYKPLKIRKNNLIVLKNRIRLKGYYLNGNKHGAMVAYDTSGRVILASRYYHDKAIGIWRIIDYSNYHNNIAQVERSYNVFWFDTQNNTIIKWVKNNRNILSIHIIKRGSATNNELRAQLNNLFNMMHDKLITTYDMLKFKQKFRTDGLLFFITNKFEFYIY